MPEIDPPTSTGSPSVEHWSWPVRVLVAIVAAVATVGVTRLIPLLHSFPLLLPLGVAISACWYLGMGPGILCTVLEAILSLPLARQSPSLAGNSVFRMGLVFAVAIVFGWILTRLDAQREQLTVKFMRQQLDTARAERELAEERAHAAEVLREREDLLQIALRANGMGLWAWDLITGRVQWSDEVYRIIGVSPRAFEPNTKAFIDFIHPEDAPRIRAAVERTRATGAEYQQQYRVQLPDGSDRWVESQGRCQRDSEGHARRIVGVIADVTARKRSDEAMLRAEKLAVAGRLAASVAHEINNPLEAVANLLYLITTGDTGEASGLAQQALDELMRVSLITQQTLKFHRQAGTPHPTRLSEVLHTVLALFRGRLQLAQIETDLLTGDELVISCMPGEVQQIFANLVSNAIDAMPQGGRLTVRLRPTRDWRNYATRGIRATFFDTGCGMDPATRRRIFEPFFTTKADTGTGLGLWVVAQLVERHGGYVSVWSTQREASGMTAVSVFLPLEIASPIAPPSAPAEALQHQ
jgi:PAS domain S-box-containing protein